MPRTFPIEPTNIQNAILNFVKNLVTKSTYKDIKTLLQPCCRPTLIGSEEYSCCDGIATCVNVTVQDSRLKNKTVTLLFTFSGNIDDNHTFSTTATFDSTGSFTDSVRVWGYVDSGEFTMQVGVIFEDSRVVTFSDPITFTSVPNCD